MNILRIRELVRKEFLQLFRDRRNRVLLIVAPLIQVLVFGYVVNYDISLIRMAVLDESRTQESRMLQRAFTGGGLFEITHFAADARGLENLLLQGRVDLAVKIPNDLTARLRGGQSAQVLILADGTMSNMASVRIAYVSRVIDSFNRRMLDELYPVTMSPGRIDARIRTWYNPNTESRFFFVPGIAAFVIMLISLLLTSIAVIREKESGTLEQLLVTPVKPYELILGKTIPYILISLVQLTFIIIVAVYWFSIPVAGSMALLFGTACLFLLSTLGIGLFISTVSATQQQAMMATFFVMLPFFLLSGFVFPIANMPLAVQWLTCLNPLRHFLVIVRGVFLKGVGIEALWPQMASLTVLGILVFAAAIARFKKRLD
ncbi:MAG TPA: ABC transporter permease [Smithellaceae bacterium]|nr:ABC transporter permease [Smithellaceae bacterium]